MAPALPSRQVLAAVPVSRPSGPAQQDARDRARASRKLRMRDQGARTAHTNHRESLPGDGALLEPRVRPVPAAPPRMRVRQLDQHSLDEQPGPVGERRPCGGGNRVEGADAWNHPGLDLLPSTFVAIIPLMHGRRGCSVLRCRRSSTFATNKKKSRGPEEGGSRWAGTSGESDGRS